MTTPYALATHDFTTPRGNTARMHYRRDTNDWNTITASMVEDEYHLKALPLLSGVAVDVGAHIGSVGIGLALDNPDLEVVCVEALPANRDLLWQNIVQNSLSDRVQISLSALGAPEQRRMKVRWRYRGTEVADHHAFIGNCALAQEHAPEYDEIEVSCLSLSLLVEIYGPIRLLKIDCEGCEWRALTDPVVASIPVIVGEWHPCPGKSCPDFKELLNPSHVCFFTGPEIGPQEFSAFQRDSLGELRI